MELLALRKQFAKTTGRYDLVNTDWSDNGADFYLNAGQRFLDRHLEFPMGRASYFKRLAADDWYAKFKNVRAIENVFINDDEGRSELTKKSRVWLMNEFTKTISETDTGTPLYYAPAQLRGMNTREKSLVGEFFRYVIPAGQDDYNGVVILPPPDEALDLEVFGLFYTEEFPTDNDEHESWWSMHHPEVLLMGASYVLEISYRNREGARDWLEALNTHTTEIDFDVVSEDIASVDQIEG